MLPFLLFQPSHQFSMVACSFAQACDEFISIFFKASLHLACLINPLLLASDFPPAFGMLPQARDYICKEAFTWLDLLCMSSLFISYVISYLRCIKYLEHSVFFSSFPCFDGFFPASSIHCEMRLLLLAFSFHLLTPATVCLHFASAAYPKPSGTFHVETTLA